MYLHSNVKVSQTFRVHHARRLKCKSHVLAAGLCVKTKVFAVPQKKFKSLEHFNASHILSAENFSAFSVPLLPAFSLLALYVQIVKVMPIFLCEITWTHSVTFICDSHFHCSYYMAIWHFESNMLNRNTPISEENLSCWRFWHWNSVYFFFFLAVSNLVYFAKLRRKHFLASDESHDQQTDAAIGANHEDDDNRKKLEYNDKACFETTYVTKLIHVWF